MNLITMTEMKGQRKQEHAELRKIQVKGKFTPHNATEHDDVQGPLSQFCLSNAKPESGSWKISTF